VPFLRSPAPSKTIEGPFVGNTNAQNAVGTTNRNPVEEFNADMKMRELDDDIKLFTIRSNSDFTINPKI
jgi:hypothetical protein